MPPAKSLEKMMDDRPDVIRAFTERSDAQPSQTSRSHEPTIQAPSRKGGIQTYVGGGNHSNRKTAGITSTRCGNARRFNHFEKLLCPKWQLGNLVKVESASGHRRLRGSRRSKADRLPPVNGFRAGTGLLQLSTRETNERSVCLRISAIDPSRDQLLADAGFSFDADRQCASASCSASLNAVRICS